MHFLSPVYRYTLSFDPKLVLKKITCPVLALNGDKDLQVSADKNLKSIEQAFKEGGNPHFYHKTNTWRESSLSNSKHRIDVGIWTN